MQTYKPSAVKVSFKGNTLTQLGKDSLIKASRDEDGWMYTPSSTGSGARTQNANRAGKCEITLLASSPSNDVLEDIATSDEQSADGVGTLQVEDTTGTGLVHAANAWVTKHPDFERMKELGECVWIFQSDDIEIRNGGTT